MTWRCRRSAIRDYNGTFGLDPGKQDLICRSIQPAGDLIDWLVHMTARLARDRAVVWVSPLTRPATQYAEGGKRTSRKSMPQKGYPAPRRTLEAELDVHTRRDVGGSASSYELAACGAGV